MHLDALSRRIIGVLLEKEATTPAQYPLSVNAIASGCGQKSNRFPIMHVSSADVESTLRDLYVSSWVTNVAQPGSRILKWKHRFDEKTGLQGKVVAILAELLLRGAQSPGELRARASRMVPIPDLANLETLIETLVEKDLVRRLPPHPGERSGRLDHNLYGQDVEQDVGQDVEQNENTRLKAPTPLNDHDRIAALEATVLKLQSRLQNLESELDIPPSP